MKCTHYDDFFGVNFCLMQLQSNKTTKPTMILLLKKSFTEMKKFKKLKNFKEKIYPFFGKSINL